MAKQIDILISLAGGVYVTLLAFRVIGPAPEADLKTDAWHKKWGRSMKIIGPLLLIISLVRLTAPFLVSNS